MADVVWLTSARECELRAVALLLIEELGAEAGLQVALRARSPKLTTETRERLLTVVEIIAQEQGFGGDFGDAEASCA